MTKIDGWYDPADKRIKWPPERLKALAQNLNDWVDENIEKGETFLLGDWCFKVGFLPSYFARYRERCKELDEAYEKAKEWQGHNIAKGALFNKLNSRFAALWLANFHEWNMNGSRDEDLETKLKSDFAKFLDFVHAQSKTKDA